ncbi:hypothetical protein PGTUg99_037651 [Puccinia graminis f. sp. tritici]|uniref:Uncharacterized protein n=1 Tax=Puccinia graminis f. sp. tritici TaxID=56615 RepID=A0A5B0SMX7_PUCGR|nr:hypothetical protein PGTUg99_037651 [Puccinia graminis f. sp. tritici]
MYHDLDFTGTEFACRAKRPATGPREGTCSLTHCRGPCEPQPGGRPAKVCPKTKSPSSSNNLNPNHAKVPEWLFPILLAHPFLIL